MEASTTLRKMIAGNKIYVPIYQRAYSWDTEVDETLPQKQTNVFISDLEEYLRSKNSTPYYFGHFLFEKKLDNRFAVIDGQQRLTTIVIFLSALYNRIEQIRPLNELELESKEDIIKRNSTYRFETVYYDNRIFVDYVVDQTKKNKNGIETVSVNRIVTAFDYFKEYLKNKDEVFLISILEAICSSTCTTHPVKDESEAIQIFIFQNNRGKKPSNLEIIKAQFMYNIHLHGGGNKEVLLSEIKERFEKIYKSIASIEYRINEDDILLYTQRVFFNSLWETNAIERINKKLTEENSVDFIKKFTQSLSDSFEHLSHFFTVAEKSSIVIHSLVSLKGVTLSFPFIIKAYQLGLETSEIEKLCQSLESILLRHRLIGTRAELTSRLNDVYEKFDSSNTRIEPIIERVEYLKHTANGWWAYWNNDELKRATQGGLHHYTAKYLLWKYENYLISKNAQNGYSKLRFDSIESPELEHISPKTPNDGKIIATGYDVYNEDFTSNYLECIGNYLLISKSHNCSVGNKPFSEKYDSYNHLYQQREIRDMTKETLAWTKELIQQRKEKIQTYILQNF